MHKYVNIKFVEPLLGPFSKFMVLRLLSHAFKNWLWTFFLFKTSLPAPRHTLPQVFINTLQAVGNYSFAQSLVFFKKNFSSQKRGQKLCLTKKIYHARIFNKGLWSFCQIYRDNGEKYQGNFQFILFSKLFSHWAISHLMQLA